MSQLLCEQVVGRALHRRSYDDFDEDGRLTEEVAKVLGVPFEVIPFKENKAGPRPPQPKRHRIHAIPEKACFEIRFPRVDRYRQGIRNRVTVDWGSLAMLPIDPKQIPSEVQVKAALLANQGRPSLMGPGRLEDITLNPFRAGRRLQERACDKAADLTRAYVSQEACAAPAHVLFPQLTLIVHRYLTEKVIPEAPAEKIDVFLSPYYGWVIERLAGAIHPDASSGEIPELPILEKNRGDGSTGEVSFWTSRDVRDVVKSHVNFAVADTKQWEQSATYLIDTNPAVDAFVKNAGLGFTIPYLDNDQQHDFEPDFIIRLHGDGARHLILETKRYDKRAEVKAQAAQRGYQRSMPKAGMGNGNSRWFAASAMSGALLPPPRAIEDRRIAVSAGSLAQVVAIYVLRLSAVRIAALHSSHESRRYARNRPRNWVSCEANG